MAKQAGKGDTVKVHYTVKHEGNEVETSKGGDPFEFVLGLSQVIPGFEKAVLGMAEGETCSTVVPPEEGYGDPNPEMIAKFPKTVLPDDLKPELGMTLGVPTEEGGTIAAIITEIDDDTITIDGNPPLAGKTIEFDIELVEIGENVAPEE